MSTTEVRSLALLVNSLATGGAETQVVELARRFQSRGWKVGVITLLGTDHLQPRLEECGIPWACLGMRRGWPNPLAIFKLIALMQKWRPDVVHSHMVHSNLLSRVARLIFSPPVLISTAHSINEGHRWRYLAYRLTSSLADATTIICHAGAKRLQEINANPPGPLLVIPNGVDFSHFTPDGRIRDRVRRAEQIDNHFCWLAVGRFDECKDYPTMLRALRKVVNQRPDAVLLIAGRGPLRADMERLACELDLHDNVRFLGIRRDVAALMNAADSFLMSSAWEGLPLVLLEASACGLPSVVTEVGGNPEVVTHGQTGFIAPSKDPSALAASMLRMMALPDIKRQQMGRAAREYATSRFDIEAIVDRWESMYLALLARNRG